MHANYVCDAVVTFCEAMDAADCERDHNFRVGFFLTFTYKFQYCVIRKIAFLIGVHRFPVLSVLLLLEIFQASSNGSLASFDTAFCCCYFKECKQRYTRCQP